MTPVKWLLLPVFLHMLMTTVIGIATVRARIAAVKSGKTRLREIALSPAAFPDRVRQLGNNYDNQFDMPVMWYALIALVIATGFVDVVMIGLSWTFLGGRLAHTLVHTGSNRVPRRMWVFLATSLVFFLMWVWFGLRLFVVG